MGDIQGYDIEDGESKRCPKCRSKQITIRETFQVYHEKNFNGKKIYYKDYRKSPYSRVFHSYACRKCGWESTNFNE